MGSSKYPEASQRTGHGPTGHLLLVLVCLFASSALGAPADGADSGAAAENRADTAGKAGLELFMRKGPCYIKSVVPGSGAEAAGIQPGEELIAVDGKPVEGQEMKDITGRIKGPAGTTVRLTLRQPGALPREVPVVRNPLPEKSREVRVATSAVPRLKVFASRQEVHSMLQALEDVRKKGDPAELATALPLVVASLAREGSLDSRARALQLLPEALEAAPTSLELPTAAEQLYLNPDAAQPAEAQAVAARALETLDKRQQPTRTVARARAAWTAVQGEAALAAGDSKEGTRLLEASLELQTGERMAALEPGGTPLWSSRLGPPDRWLKVATRRLEEKKAREAADLALEVLGWGEDPEARRVLEQALAAGARLGTDDLSAEAWPVEPAPMPPLTLTDIDGKNHELARLKGKVVIVSLWATWCGPCHQELEAFKQLYARAKDRGLEILAVSVDDDASLVAPFVQKKQLPFPAGRAPKRAALYRTRNVPVTFLVDREGRMAFSHVGYSAESFKELEEQVEALLAATSSNPQPLVAGAWRLERLELKAHAPLARVVDVTVAQGPQGPQVWALRANGVLETLRMPGRPAGKGSTASLEGMGSSGGYVAFNRIEAVDLEGDRISERALFKNTDDSVLIEDVDSGETRMFLVGASGVSDVSGVDLDGDGRQEVLVGYRGQGCRAVDAKGAARWWHNEGQVRTLSTGDVDGDGKLEVVLPGEEGRVEVLSMSGELKKTVEAGGPASRATLARLSKPGPPAIVVQDSRLAEVVAVDLDGDGLQELAGVSADGTLFVLDARGRLTSRVTFRGDRLTLAAGDLDGDHRDELVVGGEGLGVAVVGMR